MTAETTGFGHAKVILLGEHAVVHGHRALAAGVSAGVRATARPGQRRLRVPAWDLAVAAHDGSTPGAALGRVLDRLGDPALDFDVAAEVPSAAGLGSSAALAVAIARAAAAHVGAADDAVMDAVAASEAVFHRTPSGIDAAAAFYGGVGRFVRGEGWSPIVVRQKVKLLVGLSGRKRDTGEHVAAVGRLAARMPVAQRMLTALGECAIAGEAALAEGDIDTLGRLFDAAHGLLSGLRLSTPELDQLVHGARAAGAIGAKLTGAGGGGAVIAIAPSHRSDVLARWQGDGFDGFEAMVPATIAEAKR